MVFAKVTTEALWEVDGVAVPTSPLAPLVTVKTGSANVSAGFHSLPAMDQKTAMEAQFGMGRANYTAPPGRRPQRHHNQRAYAGVGDGTAGIFDHLKHLILTQIATNLCLSGNG